jgi:hypothetical protein
MRKPIPSEVIGACQMEFEKRAAFRFKDGAVLAALIETDRYLKKKLMTYAGPEPLSGLDTYERHYLFDVFAAKYIDGLDHWPINNDGEDKSIAFLAGIEKLSKEGVIDVIP